MKKDKTEQIEDKKENIKSEILSWVKTIILAIVIYFVITQGIIVNATVTSGSMEDTIMTDDRIMGNRLSYLFGKPSRGHIIVFKAPAAADITEPLYVKRVVGLPGETIEIKDGAVYIDGSAAPLDEEYVNEISFGSYGPIEIPEDHYFVMGDNRNSSKDSRMWGTLSEDRIIAKAFWDYYPSPHLIK